MEDELLAQRDAAIAVSKELQRQLQQQRDVVEKTIERRAFRAERLRLRAEENLRRVTEDRQWEHCMNARQLYLSLFSGMVGAIVGWSCGLLVFIVFSQPTIGFLLVLPGMASGTLLGLALAKTRVQLETHRRDARRRKSRNQFDGSNDDEIEAMLFDYLDDDQDLDAGSPMGQQPPLSSSSMVSNSLTFRTTSQSSQDFQQQQYHQQTASYGGGGGPSSSDEPPSSSSSKQTTSLWKSTGNLMYQTAVTSKDFAMAVYDSKSFVSGLLYGSRDNTSGSSSKSGSGSSDEKTK